MISDKEILNNMTADEKFKIICRARKIDIDEIGEEIYKTIENHDEYEYRKDYLTICAYEDESMAIEDVFALNIDDGLLYSKDDWIKSHMDEYGWLSYEECEQMDWELYTIEDKFTEEQKEFIKLAIECEVDRIILRWM